MLSDERRIGARSLEVGTQLALVVLTVTFAVYLSGILEPLVAMSELTRLWQLSADQYVAATGAPTGWGWLRRLGYGDYLNMLGIALCALVPIVGYASLTLAFMRERERIHALLSFLQVIVLVAAALASGVG
ncbi:MAG: hypothetical protein ABR570_10390 [Burkholderiales bacterium]